MLDATSVKSETRETQPTAFELDSQDHPGKFRNAWQEACRYAWFNPQFWVELLTHPSTKLEKVYKRRRARLYSLLCVAFLIVSIVTNVLAFQDNRGVGLVVTNLVVNLMLLVSYVLSRTKKYLLAKNIGVLACWLLPYVAVVVQLNDDTNTADNDIAVTDSFNWLFTPAWMLMAAVFLSRESTISLLILDAAACFLIPGISNATFFQIRKLLFFHMVNNLLLLLSTIIHFRDKLQLNQQQADADGEGWERDPSTGQGPIARLLLQPHPEVVDRIFRRRSRVLSVVLLCLIPLTIIWSIAESFKWKNSEVNSVLISMSVILCAILIVLYAISRSKHTRWASRLTLFLFLVAPYFYLLAPQTTQEGQLYAALLATTAAAILGVTLLSGQELITLACVVFFTTIYSPSFPPHIVMSVCLLCAALAHRHDMQEIERTKPTEDIRQQRVVSDGTNLKIPFDKKYCGGYLSYSNYVRFQYAFTFCMMFALGIVALVAIYRSDATENPTFNVQLDGSVGSVNTNYQLFITTFDCSNSGTQQYDVIGTKGNFHYVNHEPLLPNMVTILNVQSEGDVGFFTSVSMSLGAGGMTIATTDSCQVYKVEAWDVARNLGVTTQEDYLDENAESAPNPKAPTHAVLAAHYSVENWWGAIVRCPRSKFDFNRIYKNRQCDFNLVRGPLNWKKIWCPRPRSLDPGRCNELKCYSPQTPDLCNGHGDCLSGVCFCDGYFTDGPVVKDSKGNIINNGKCSVPNTKACDNSFTVNCASNPNQGVCPNPAFIRYRSPDGSCNFDTSVKPDDGLAGMPMSRLAPAVYSDGNDEFAKNSVCLNGNCDLPNERDVSNRFFAQPGGVLQDNSTSHFNALFYGFFKFLYNDMMFITQTNEIEFITIPKRTTQGGSEKSLVLPITLNAYAQSLNTGFEFKVNRVTKTNPAQFDNTVTYWVDGSSIYGVDPDEEMFFREQDVTIVNLPRGRTETVYTPTETGRIFLDCPDNQPYGDWSDCFPPVDNDGNFVIFDSRNTENPATFAFHVLFMREHNRIVDIFRGQADCSKYQQALGYVGSYGTLAQSFNSGYCGDGRPVIPGSTFIDPTNGQWDGDDVYRLARILVGLQIQSIAQEWLTSWFGRAAVGVSNQLDLGGLYQTNPSFAGNGQARLNSGLSLESAQLFNLPTLMPSFYQRKARNRGDSCNPTTSNIPIGTAYLSSIRTNFDDVLQGVMEQGITTQNGVLDANRGQQDQMAILIRRNRELGLPSFTTIRKAVATTNVCTPVSWTDSTCKPTTLWSQATVDKLKLLYGKPSDVDLTVGSMLSIETFKATNNLPLDKTQAYLVLGEIDRIIRLDAFGIRSTNFNNLINRAYNDDIQSGFIFSTMDVLTQTSLHRRLQDLINDNTNLRCIPQYAFSTNGFSTLQDPGFNPLQTFSTDFGGYFFNCDLSQAGFDGYNSGPNAPPSYSSRFCGDPTVPLYDCAGISFGIMPFCV